MAPGIRLEEEISVTTLEATIQIQTSFTVKESTSGSIPSSCLVMNTPYISGVLGFLLVAGILFSK
jgi:hypothetical protein